MHSALAVVVAAGAMKAERGQYDAIALPADRADDSEQYRVQCRARREQLAAQREQRGYRDLRLVVEQVGPAETGKYLGGVVRGGGQCLSQAFDHLGDVGGVHFVSSSAVSVA